MGIVYVLTDDNGHYKIGYTYANDPRIRQWGCQTGNPLQLRLLFSWEDENAELTERALHIKYRPYKTRNYVNTGEWYTFTEQQLEELKNTKSITHTILDNHNETHKDRRYPEGYSRPDVRQVLRIQRRQSVAGGEALSRRQRPASSSDREFTQHVIRRKYKKR